MATSTDKSNRPEPLALDERLPGLTTPASVQLLSLLVYGASGVGKTVLAGTAEDDERTAPVLFCDAEAGSASISHRGRALHLYPIRDFAEDMNRLIAYFRAAKAEGNLPYKTVVMDSMTEIGWKAMGAMLDHPNAKRESPDALEYGEWNLFINRMRFLVTFFRDLHINVIMTALEDVGDKWISPSIPGKKVRENLPAFFDTVGRLVATPVPSADGKETVQRRRLVLSSDVRFAAKDRSNKFSTLPKFVDDPNITKLLDRMEEGRAEALKRAEASR